MLFETIYYTVNRIDGDYAYLVREENATSAFPSAVSPAHSPEEKCVAKERADANTLLSTFMHLHAASTEVKTAATAEVLHPGPNFKALAILPIAS